MEYMLKLAFVFGVFLDTQLYHHLRFDSHHE